MQFVSFNPLRTLHLSGARYIKPELYIRHLDEVQQADWILFPEYWQVNTLVYGLQKRIFPSSASYHLGHDKVEMTRAFQALFPAHVPHTAILPPTAAAYEQILEQFDFPLVAKEVRNSMGRGVYLIENRSQLRDYIERNAVLYVQERLPIERDLRVVVVGRKVVTAYWRIAAEGSFHNNVAQGGSVSFDEIPSQALQLVERVAAACGIDHAGFDVAVVDGHCYLLEFNTLFGTDALNARGIRIEPLILEYLSSISGQSPDGPGRRPPLAA